MNRQTAKRLGVLLAAGSVLAAGALAGPSSRPGEASNHLDAPSTDIDNQMDVTDMYLYTPRDNTDMVTVMVNWTAFEIPGQILPWYRFAERAHYDLYIDNDGDARPEFTYRFTFRHDDGQKEQAPSPEKPQQAPGIPFTMPWSGKSSGKDPMTAAKDAYLSMLKAKAEVERSGAPRRTSAEAAGRAARQSYTIELIRPGKPKTTLVKDVSIPPRGPRRAAVSKLPGGGLAYAGPHRDPFFYWLPTNVHGISLQLPKKRIALGGDSRRNPVVGMWAKSFRHSIDLRTGEKKVYQVSRQGLSGFSSAILPIQMRDKYHQATDPSTDHKWKSMRAWLKTGAAGGLFGLTFPVPLIPQILPQNEQIYLWGIAKSTGPIKRDLNAHVLNKDADKNKIIPGEMVRLNMTTPPSKIPRRHGLLDGDEQGWPHGRRLSDDTFTGFFRLGAGEPALPISPLFFLTATPLSGTNPFGLKFPYVYPPY